MYLLAYVRGRLHGGTRKFPKPAGFWTDLEAPPVVAFFGDRLQPNDDQQTQELTKQGSWSLKAATVQASSGEAKALNSRHRRITQGLQQLARNVGKHKVQLATRGGGDSGGGGSGGSVGGGDDNDAATVTMAGGREYHVSQSWSSLLVESLRVLRRDGEG